MMIRLLIALATAAALAAAGTAYADSLILYMFPGDYAAYTCGGSWSATVADGHAYAACTRKGVIELDVDATCFGDVTVDVSGQTIGISCH